MKFSATDRGIVYLVWASHSARAESISKRLNASIFFFSSKTRQKIFSPAKYIYYFLKTIQVLIKKRPEVIISQSPPIFCTLSALVYTRLLRGHVQIIIDAHTGEFDRPWIYLKYLSKLIMKNSTLVLVSNEDLQRIVSERYSARSLVLEDMVQNIAIKQVTLEKNASQDKAYDLKIAVISSFANDEPIEEVIEAARNSVLTRFYITGDLARAQRRISMATVPGNVVFTGFLAYNDYIALLERVEAIMVLTKRDKTLLAGGYEALALEKPLITSNWKTLKDYYVKGALHVDNSTEEIVNSVTLMKSIRSRLQREMSELKTEKQAEWEEKFSRLLEFLPKNQ